MVYQVDRATFARLTGWNGDEDFWTRLANRDPNVVAGLRSQYDNLMAGIDTGRNPANTNALLMQGSNLLADYLGINRPFKGGEALASGTAYRFSGGDPVSAMPAVATAKAPETGQGAPNVLPWLAGAAGAGLLAWWLA